MAAFDPFLPLEALSAEAFRQRSYLLKRRRVANADGIFGGAVSLMNVEQRGDGLFLLFGRRRPSHEVIDFVSCACPFDIVKERFRCGRRIAPTKQSSDEARYRHALKIMDANGSFPPIPAIRANGIFRPKADIRPTS